MKRRFTKYPSGYVKANSDNHYDNIYAIDFYRKMYELVPLQTVYVIADSKEEARGIAYQLADIFGYEPQSATIQFAYITQGWLDMYCMQKQADGIPYYVKAINTRR